MDLEKSLAISASGMQAQTTRLTTIAQNLANQDSTGSTPGAEPYRRKTVTFADKMDRALGVELVSVRAIGKDRAAFPMRYDPANPAADAQGYVKLPNVNALVELADMRAAERSYQANLSVMQTTRGMLTRTIGMLR
ncbi:MAG TPA: flagellar basal body rod protein FlgC [Acetobacteraceae bacterium]|nr:flagellar basal body rod protein FlgC [Acetobacteraceae bacterium]